MRVSVVLQSSKIGRLYKSKHREVSTDCVRTDETIKEIIMFGFDSVEDFWREQGKVISGKGEEN